MVAFKAHFDGHVIIPSGRVDLPQGRELLFHVDEPSPMTGVALLKLIDSFDKPSARQMADAMEQVVVDS